MAKPSEFVATLAMLDMQNHKLNQIISFPGDYECAQCCYCYVHESCNLNMDAKTRREPLALGRDCIAVWIIPGSNGHFSLYQCV